MILLKSALPSIFVVLGACDRAQEGTPSAPNPPTAVVERDRSATAHTAAKPTAAPPREAARTVYVCPMHPEIVSDTPGLCPKCT